LIQWGATHVFGVVGDGINPLIEALRKRQDRIAYIGARHEEAAAFMACGMAKHTGRLGVCAVSARFGTSGTLGKLAGSSSNVSFDPTARRSGVSGCANAAFTADSSVLIRAWPSANRFWCVPQARNAAAWLEAETTES
jgi:hypothetical protein